MAGVEVALAHDYATQRGGAERVALMMAEAFPGAPMVTTLHHPAGTFPEFGDLNLRTSGLNRFGLLRRSHRLALPLLAGAVDRTPIDADLVLASSTGWAHGFPVTGRKVVYCHAPARWLYQGDRYLGRDSGGAKQWLMTRSLRALAPRLRDWDQRAAATADRYLANSTVTARAIQEVYGIEAEVVPPPPAMLPDGPEASLPVEPGFLLCVARLLPYKNVDVVIDAVRLSPGRRLVVVGDGPERAALEQRVRDAGIADRVTLAGRVDDARLRWLYRNCSALVAASYEDYGLSPLEAAAFGHPSVVLHDGGYLDTVRGGVTGEFFPTPTAEDVAAAIDRALIRDWDADLVRAHAESFGLPRFVARLRAVVDAELGRTPAPLVDVASAPASTEETR